MLKSPSYDKSSQELSEECANDVALIEARKEIYAELSKSIQILKQLRLNEDASIQLKACREHLLLAGLYVEKSEVNNKGSISLVISPDQAAKVVNAATDDSGNL